MVRAGVLLEILESAAKSTVLSRIALLTGGRTVLHVIAASAGDGREIWTDAAQRGVCRGGRDWIGNGGHSDQVVVVVGFNLIGQSCRRCRALEYKSKLGVRRRVSVGRGGLYPQETLRGAPEVRSPRDERWTCGQAVKKHCQTVA